MTSKTLPLLLTALAMSVLVSTASAQTGKQALKNENGATVVNTATLAADVKGHAGPTPVNIYIRSGKVERITAAPNSETPAFFRRAFQALKDKWTGLKPTAARKLKVDAVSGATQSSKAIIANVQCGLDYYKKAGKTVQKSKKPTPQRRPDAVSGASPMH